MALPGIAMVPLAWGTAVELGLTGRGRHIVTLMVLCGEPSVKIRSKALSHSYTFESSAKILLGSS